MRVMVIVKATKNSEAGVMPSDQLLADMGKFNEELVRAGVMLTGEGVHPSSKGKRCPDPMPGEEAVLEIRPVFEAADFGEEFTPELRAHEERLRTEIERQRN
ncbi:MAG: YciI family protein [Thermoanaerobaculia bacterium]